MNSPLVLGSLKTTTRACENTQKFAGFDDEPLVLRTPHEHAKTRGNKRDSMMKPSGTWQPKDSTRTRGIKQDSMMKPSGTWQPKDHHTSMRKHAEISGIR